MPRRNAEAFACVIAELTGIPASRILQAMLRGVGTIRNRAWELADTAEQAERLVRFFDVHIRVRPAQKEDEGLPLREVNIKTLTKALQPDEKPPLEREWEHFPYVRIVSRSSIAKNPVHGVEVRLRISETIVSARAYGALAKTMLAYAAPDLECSCEGAWNQDGSLELHAVEFLTEQEEKV